MKRILTFILSVCFAASMAAQQVDAQQVAAEAAGVISQAPEVSEQKPKPKYWDNSIKTQVTFGQAGLFNWAAGGDNTVSLKAYVDANANWKKDKMFWNNRLQLDFGFLYASSKPLLQKSDDRIYLESKWGYQAVDKLFASANFDFKSQFAPGYTYATPGASHMADLGFTGDLDDLSYADKNKVWKHARTLKSSFLSPAYTNLALGLDYVPTKWLSLSLAPLTGGFVIVTKKELRKNYGMELQNQYETLQQTYASYDESTATEAQKAEYASLQEALKNGSAYNASRFELGVQLKADIKVNINDNFKYTSQIVLFGDYLTLFDKDPMKRSYRFNWDNRFDWRIAKMFSIVLTTNMIYDSKVLITTDKDIDQFPEGKRRLQFMESLQLGFTYTISSKKK